MEQSITNLTQIIGTLLSQQKRLTDTGNQNSATFQNVVAKIDSLQKSLQTAATRLNAHLSALNSSSSALQKNQSLTASLIAANDKYAKSTGDGSKLT